MKRLSLLLVLLIAAGCSWPGAGKPASTTPTPGEHLAASIAGGQADDPADEESDAESEPAGEEQESDAGAGSHAAPAKPSSTSQPAQKPAAETPPKQPSANQGSVDPLPAHLAGEVSTLSLDLNGDGRPETVRGIFDQWTSTAFIEVVDGGDVLTRATFPGYRRVIPVSLSYGPSAFLLWERDPYGGQTVQVTQFRYLNDHWVNVTPGFEGYPSDEGVPATSARLNADGILDVEWELGDPMGHVQIQHYQITFVHGVYPWRETTIRHKVTYPTDPLGLLQSALANVVLPHNDQEFASFFANTAAQNAFYAAVPSGSAVENAAVHLACGTISGSCSVSLQPAQLGPDGTAPFVIETGTGITTGTASFTTDGSGKLLIQSINITGSCRR